MITDTRLYLDEVEDFIQQNPNIGAIESHLAEHALITICAAFELEIRDALTARCAVTGDLGRDQFVSGSIQRVVRSIGVSDLTGILGGFGEGYKTSYSSWMNDNPQAATAYNNIVTNRNAVAHGGQRQASWRDVYGWWDEAQHVVNEFRSTLTA
ncbi:MAG: HEPN domain-containing protein [Acidimicrobiaceae bacterium]|nr:HEPN domain-containing protein [Acidimicrobiaceae bacterium]